ADAGDRDEHRTSRGVARIVRCCRRTAFHRCLRIPGRTPARRRRSRPRLRDEPDGRRRARSHDDRSHRCGDTAPRAPPRIERTDRMIDVLINIDVDDLERAVAFYRDAFGLTLSRRLGAGAVELVGASSRIYLLRNTEGSAPLPTAPNTRRTYARHWTPVHLD